MFLSCVEEGPMPRRRLIVAVAVAVALVACVGQAVGGVGVALAEGQTRVVVSRDIEAGPVVAGGRLVWLETRRRGALALRRSQGSRAQTTHVFRPSGPRRLLSVRELAASGDRFVLALSELGPSGRTGVDGGDTLADEVFTGVRGTGLTSLARCSPTTAVPEFQSDMSLGISAGRVVYRLGDCKREGLDRFVVRDFRPGRSSEPQPLPAPAGGYLIAFGGSYLVTRTPHPASTTRLTDIDTGSQRVLSPPRGAADRFFRLALDERGRAVVSFRRRRGDYVLHRVSLPAFALGERLATSRSVIRAGVSGRRVVIERSPHQASRLDLVSPVRRKIGSGGLFDLQGPLLGFVTGCGRELRLSDLRERTPTIPPPRCRP